MRQNIIDSANSGLKVADPDGPVGSLELNHQPLARAFAPFSRERHGHWTVRRQSG
jgi:hypothetical protein